MPKSKKSSNKIGGYLAESVNKEDRLDWNNFNFLENLLIFCTELTRNAPKETGIHFHISSKAKDGAICLLFKTDRSKDSLFLNEKTPRGNPIKRPDYMVFYAKGTTCIITIMEMKGGKNDLKHGIEQIKQLKNILNREIIKHLPNKFKFTIQGILLTPNNTQIPISEIAKLAKQNFYIFPIRCSRKAELFPYVSKINNKIDEKYKHEKLPHDKDEFGFIEKILAEQALPSRIEDNFKKQNFVTGKNREDLYINYALSKDEYAVLFLNKLKKTIAIKQNNETHKQKIAQELEKTGMNFFTIKSI